MEKICTNCKKTLPISEFGKHSASRNGLNPCCKCCVRERGKQQYRNMTKEEKESRSKKAKQYVIENAEKRATAQKQYYLAHKNKILNYVKEWAQSNPDKTYTYVKRSRTKHSNETKARTAVGNAVRRGKISPASSFICACCGMKPAAEYHHHLGYEKQHWLDVTPLCNDCHKD